MKFSLKSKLLLLVISIYSTQVISVRVVCYFDNQMQYSQGSANYTMDDINTTLCTHLVYNYVTIEFDPDEIVLNLEENKKYEQFANLKHNNPKLKLMISIPCWIYDLPTMVSKKEIMIRMINNIVKFLHQFKFEGLEVDTRFCKKDLIIYFTETLGQTLVSKNILFSIAVGGNDIDSISQSEVTRLKRYLDFINIHTYEFRIPQNPQADHHAPLYNRTWDRPTNQSLDIDSLVNKWIDKGFPSDKIVIGIPLFGISWTLSSNQITPPAPATGPGNLLTKARNRDGYIPYYEICQAVRYKSWKVYPKNEQMGPFAVSPYNYRYNRTWVGYDDPAMAIAKSEYILSKGLGGAAVADVNMDDFNDRCGGGFNPMMTAIYNTLLRDNHQTIELPEATNSTTQNNETSSTIIETATAIQFKPKTPSSSYDENSDNNSTCVSSRITYAIPLVIFAFLLLTLFVVLAKIFCVKRATQ